MDNVETVQAYKYNDKLYENEEEIMYAKLLKETELAFEESCNYFFDEWKCTELSDIVDFVKTHKEFFKIVVEE